MKKILLVALAMMMVVSGAYAQNKTTSKNKKVPSSAVTKDDGTMLQTEAKVIDIREMPPAEMGLEMTLAEALKNRRTVRTILPEELPMEMISSLLWSAYGINRPEEGRRVVPSAVNVQEFDIYLFTLEGIFRYNAEKNNLEMLVKGDYRGEISEQSFFKEAPVSIVLVANYDRMKVFKDIETRDFYAAVDCGYISQNIYLYCASAKLATVACGGIKRDHIEKLLGLKNARPLLAHPVGFGK